MAFFRCLSGSGGGGDAKLSFKNVSPFSSRVTILTDNNYLYENDNKIYCHVEMTIRANQDLTASRVCMQGFPNPVSSTLDIVWDSEVRQYCFRKAMTSGQTYNITDDYEINWAR